LNSGILVYSSSANQLGNLQTISFPKLKTVSGGNAISCYGADLSNVNSLYFQELTSVNGSLIKADNLLCLSSLKELRFPKLESITLYLNTFLNRLGNLESLYFDSLEETVYNFINNENLAYVVNNTFTYCYFGYKTNDRTKSIIVKFSNITSLTDIELKQGYLKNFDCSRITALTETNILNHILNRLGDNTGQSVLTLTLGATNLAKLTSAESQARLAELQTQGWTIA